MRQSRVNWTLLFQYAQFSTQPQFSAKAVTTAIGGQLFRSPAFTLTDRLLLPQVKFPNGPCLRAPSPQTHKPTNKIIWPHPPLRFSRRRFELLLPRTASISQTSIEEDQIPIMDQNGKRAVITDRRIYLLVNRTLGMVFDSVCVLLRDPLGSQFIPALAPTFAI